MSACRRHGRFSTCAPRRGIGSASRPREGRLEMIINSFPSPFPRVCVCPPRANLLLSPSPRPARPGWSRTEGGTARPSAFQREREKVEGGKRNTSTFSSLKCTLLASCSLVPTSGYFVSWKRFSNASSCSSVKIVRCRLFRLQCSWLSNCSSVRDKVPTFM